MKLAIFGGTGFLGYDFVKLISADPGVTVTIYSSSPKSLVNLARHEFDIRLISVAQFDKLDIDSDTDFIINFAHPFGLRDELSTREQMDLFVNFIARQKRNIPKLRLVHLSTMSVYEPFKGQNHFSEDARLAPPKSDGYASDKVYIESRIKTLPQSGNWQIHLRPTIVYGPFCRPWTDRILESFSHGKVFFRDLSGHVQPILGHDISRFIRFSLSQFKPGTYNLAGAEEMTWLDFMRFFEEIVGIGELVCEPASRPAEHGPSVSYLRFLKENIKELTGVISNDESFIRMASPLVRKLPRRLVVWVRDNIFGAAPDVPTTSAVPVLSPFASDFFAEDRLVSRTLFTREFPDFTFSQLSDTKRELTKYYEFRFTDGLVRWKHEEVS